MFTWDMSKFSYWNENVTPVQQESGWNHTGMIHPGMTVCVGIMWTNTEPQGVCGMNLYWYESRPGITYTHPY